MEKYLLSFDPPESEKPYDANPITAIWVTPDGVRVAYKYTIDVGILNGDKTLGWKINPDATYTFYETDNQT